MLLNILEMNKSSRFIRTCINLVDKRISDIIFKYGIL